MVILSSHNRQPYILFSICLWLLVLCSCGGANRPAPVRNISIDPAAKNSVKAGTYKVRKSDTLYSIAFRFGIDFQQLARINQIKIPYTIYPGQTLRLRYSSKPTISRAKKYTSKKIVAKQQNKIIKKPVGNNKSTVPEANSSFDKKKKVTAWLWPVKNKALNYISSGKDGQQGIDISGRLGEPIAASADGRVVYSGNGLVGYGNLIIIKHSQSYLSAYAHNDKLLVSEKDTVKAGQKIATMGKNGTNQVQLHFEIRYQGRPVNPLKYLPPLD